MPLLLPTTLASRLEARSRSSYFTSDQITAKGPEKSVQDSQGLRICHHVEDLDEAPGSGLRNESVSSESSLANLSVVGEHKINTQKWPCLCTQELNKTSEKEINEVILRDQRCGTAHKAITCSTGTHMREGSSPSAAPLPTQLLASARRNIRRQFKSLGPRAPVADPHEDPDFHLAWPWLFQPLGKQTRGWKRSPHLAPLFCYPCLSNQSIDLKTKRWHRHKDRHTRQMNAALTWMNRRSADRSQEHGLRDSPVNRRWKSRAPRYQRMKSDI